MQEFERASDEEIRSAFGKSVEEGHARLARSWPGLVSTGLVGGIDVMLGVLALLVVQHETGSHLLGALAFTIGFVALALGKSELFTENFLVPVAAVVAGRSTIASLIRLWLGTLALNLAGGWVLSWLVVRGLPELAPTAVDVGAVYPALTSMESVALGILGGIVITLMTWIEHAARSEAGKLTAVIGLAFLLVAGPLNHVIVGSLEMFAGIHTGVAGYGYVDWLRVAAWATLTNMAGGIVFVTGLRLAQVGGDAILEERHRSR